MTRRARRPVQISRTVGYRIDLQERGRCLTDESGVERILAAHPDVTEFDTGRGWIVWWNVRPGPAARALRKRLELFCAEHSEERPGEREHWLRTHRNR